VRRKFDEAAKASKKSGSAHEALARIGKIYHVERDLRAQMLSAEAFVQNRKDQVLPVLQDFKQWLEAKALQVPPSVLLGKAVSYALKEWEKLLNYLDSPYLTPDTNMIENAIRPFVLGRNYAESNIMLSSSVYGMKAVPQFPLSARVGSPCFSRSFCGTQHNSECSKKLQ